ncbi:hypothetical protein [Streptomyces formicae]
MLEPRSVRLAAGLPVVGVHLVGVVVDRPAARRQDLLGRQSRVDLSGRQCPRSARTAAVTNLVLVIVCLLLGVGAFAVGLCFGRVVEVMACTPPYTPSTTRAGSTTAEPARTAHAPGVLLIVSGPMKRGLRDIRLPLMITVSRWDALGALGWTTS